MKTKLIFVRHAEAEGNIKRLFHGWYNSNLTSKGKKQAELVSDRLADVKIDVLYSSVLNRTFKTASYISEKLGLPIITSPNLKEINGGDWEDVSWEDLPNGETMVGFQDRLLKEIYRIIDENEGKNICIVTHGTAIKALKCKFMGLKLNDMQAVSWCDNTAVTVVDYDGETNKFDIVMDGDASHLPYEMKTIVHQDWWKRLSEEQARGDTDGKDI